MKKVLITGATSGIGRACALLFASKGMVTICAGRDQKKGDDLLLEIEKRGGRGRFIKTDLSHPSSIQGLFQTIEKEFQTLDIAFNNAGKENPNDKTLLEIEEKEWDEIMNINLKGVWLCMKGEIPLMSQGGVIINNTSIVVEKGFTGTSCYTASKCGVKGLTRVAAVEYGPKIRINAISPGTTDTPMLRRIFSEGELKEIVRSNPMKRLGTPEDIAQAVFWLSSEEASYINGVNLTIDGGEILL